jgi:hypothetical protein
LKPILLLGGNFVREQRWPLLLLLVGVVALAALGMSIDLRKARAEEEVILIFKQMAMYGVAFSILFGGSALHNERRSRRILSVLSKAVGRREYLTGLLTGVGMASGLYSFVLAFTGTWVLGSVGVHAGYLWYLMGCLFTVSLLGAGVAVLFSTFLSPWPGAVATLMFLFTPAALSRMINPEWGYILPAYSLTSFFLNSSFQSSAGDAPVAIPVVIAWLEVVLLWLVASRIFEETDVAVAVD